MAKNNFLSWDTTANNNTDVAGINIAEGCAPSGINNAMRAIMAQLRADIDGGMVYAAKSANYTAVANDNNGYLRFTAAATLSLTAVATLGADWHVFVQADGGDVIVDPNASETINGATTITIRNGESALIISNGTAFFAHIGPPAVTYAAKSGNYTAVASDNGAVHRYTATATVSLTAATTLGANWHYTVIADGADVTIDPNGSETIDGATTQIVKSGSAAFIINSGTAFFTDKGSTANAHTWTALQTFIRAASSGGTVNGNAAIALDSNGATILQMLSPNNNVTALYFGDPDNAAIGRMQYNHSDDTMSFWRNNAEVGRFGATGAFLVGRTDATTLAVDSGIVLDPAGAIVVSRDGTGAQNHIFFVNNAAVTPAQVGSVSTNLSATAYNTSSDERLKEYFRDFDAGVIIDAIGVYHYDWKIGGSGYGVKAQKCFEVFPDAVTVGSGEPGEEDFTPWSVDYSKFVPLLMREVQELRKRVSHLEPKEK